MANGKRGRPARDTAQGSAAGLPEPGSHVTSDAILEQAADSDRVQIWRYNTGTGSFNYAATYEPAVVRTIGLNEFVRARGGAGKYRARIRRADGTYGLSTTFTIEGQPRAWTEPGGELASSSSAAAAPIAGGTILEKLLTPMAAAFGAFAAKKFLEDKQADPLVLELLKRGGATDQLELQRAIAEAEARGEARGRELGKLHARADAPRDGSGGAIGALERNIPKLLSAVHRHMDIEESKVKPHPAAPPALPAAVDAAASTSPAPAAAIDRDPLEALLLSVPMAARKFLFAAAQNGEPAAVYAPIVISKLDEVTRARLPELLERDDFAATVIRCYPGFTEYPEWVDELADALRDSYEPEDDDQDGEQDNHDAGAAS